MSYDHSATRLMKTLPRQLVWSMLKEPAKRVLLFPGLHCEDIILGLNLNKINEDTELVLIERDVNIAQAIKGICDIYHLKKVLVLNQDFDKHTLFGQGKFDIAFLDFCGDLTETIYWALKSLPLAADKIAMTFCTNNQRNSFKKENPDYRKSFTPPPGAHRLYHSKGNGAEWACDTALNAMGLTSKSLMYFFPYQEIHTEKCSTKYGRPMVFFAIDTNKESQPKKGKELMTKTVGRIGAGRKAAITRQINELQRQYKVASSAGVKSGITKRIKALKASYPK